jgi:hypothetical protein
LFFVVYPFSGIRADLCVFMLERLEHMVNMGIDFIIVTLACALVHIAPWFDEAALANLTCTLTCDWFHT